MTNTMEIIKN